MGTTLPSAHSYIIKRPRLTKLLDESTARIILLCAPAGYGKTTLAREWVATRTEPVAWYRGGIEMLDSAAVANALADVLVPLGLPDGVRSRVAALVARTQQPQTAARLIANEVRAEQNAILVLDNYDYAAEALDSETLLATFSAETHLRLLITSRVRPSWLASRMSVYGEALILTAEDLAFSDEEARQVLAVGPSKSRGGVLERAKGWPAVIGLAALRRDAALAIGEATLPADLYSYFAEDLFRDAKPALRQSLYKLALGGDAELAITQELLGDDYAAHIAVAVARGFLTRTEASALELHPLVRSFLLAKLREGTARDVTEVVNQVVLELASHRRWDECLAALTEFPLPEPITRVLSTALDDLLATGRVATVARWIDLARETGRSDPVLLLAEAEVALRAGDDGRAQVVAERAGELLASGETAANAFIVAARAANLRGDGPAAERNARRAQTLTNEPTTRFTAQWLTFLHAVEEQDPRARQILNDLKETGNATSEQALRVINGSAFLALEVDGDIRQAVRESDLGIGLLPHIRDPLVRTTFLNVAASSMLSLAHYDRCLDLSERQIQDAGDNGIDFAVDHALANRAGALIGRRKLSQAQRVLKQLESTLGPTTAGFIVAQTQLKRARLKVAAGDITRADVLLRRTPPAGVTRALLGEWFGTRALLAAARGEISWAVTAIEHTRQFSTVGDAGALADLAEAVVTITSHGDVRAESAPTTVLRRIVRNGYLDNLVLACRACPPLTRSVTSDAELVDELTRLLATSADIDIGRAAGLEMPRELRQQGTLSRRERDVYELLGHGRSNREIAQALFISESTTKVHVRHIFEKLGVHSRAEAALADVDALDG